MTFSLQMRSFTVRLSVVFAMLCASVLSLSAAATFDSANQLYDQGKFQDARQQYEQLLSSGQSSANVYYNLGNTDYRLDSKGQATLDYERALALEPTHPEAQANLKLVREQCGALLLPVTWMDRIVLPLRENVYVVLAAASVWTIILSGAFMGLWRRMDSLGLWAVCLAALLAAGYSGLALWHSSQNRGLGIVTAKEVTARLAPADRAGTVENLPAGSRVRVLSERSEWVYCELPGQSRGWIPSDSVEKITVDRHGKS
jgi:tetratricopeptide (TPR) repeat protein